MLRDAPLQGPVPARLAGEGVLEYAFTLDAAGEAWAALTLDAPDTSWARGAAAVVGLEIDRGSRQEVILAGGDEPTEYLRFLGRLSRGRHVLRLEIDSNLSPRGVQKVVLTGARTGAVADADPGAPVWRHAPVLHYRALETRLDSLSTDTPLLLFYRILPDPAGAWDNPGLPATATFSPEVGTRIEYHVVYSHEDAGTDLTGLLARWGHTVDIEWIYRVTFDSAGRVVGEEFQGSGHTTGQFRGTRAMGEHPVLQIASTNGMVTDRVTCPFAVALAPACAQPAGEPREGVLQRFPWIYRVSALEVVRQVPLDPKPSPASPAAADPRRYVFLQWKRKNGPLVPLEATVRVSGTWYPSAWGRTDLALAEPDGESTAVRVPPGTTETQISGIALRALERPRIPLEVSLIRAFFLNEDYLPRPVFAAGGVCRLDPQKPWAVAWESSVKLE